MSSSTVVDWKNYLREVALIGLNSLFGQASSLLLKLCPNIYNLRLYDDTDTSTAEDIKVINTPCKVEAYQGKTKLKDAIKGSDIVLIGDDILSTPQTCFDVMAPKMQDYAKAIAESSPNALIIVAASPVSKLVPVLSELLQENGYYDCNRVMGTTACHNIRANCILASYVNTDPRSVFLPVVGGDSENTIVPLFSQAKPHFNISEAVMKRLIEDIKQAPTLIYETKGSTEALNKAHATVKFLNSVIAGLRGEPNIMNIAFTKTTQVDGTEYFALPVLLGRFGIQARYGIPRILPFENDLIRDSVFSLQKDIEFAKLFCKSRETAAETCSRNVAIRYRKSKEFEQFVNGLKMNKNGNIAEDKIADKLKPPVPVESGQLLKDNSFDMKAFCLRHKRNDSDKNRIIPTYMRTGQSIMPVSLGYTFGSDNGIAQFVPKSSSAETLICEPAVCPDKPKEREMSYTNLVSLVERLVKRTTEKMINEKEKDESLSTNFTTVENLKHGSEKDKNLKMNPDKVDNCLRKIDCLKLNSENIGNFKSISKRVPNLSQKGNQYSKNNGIIKNKSIPIKNVNAIPTTKVNINKKIDEKINLRKRKYPEKTLESIFSPAHSTFKERFDYKSGIRKHNNNDLKQAEIKTQNNEKYPETSIAKHDNYQKPRKVFNYNFKSQSSQSWNRITPYNNIPIVEENNRNSIINKNISNQIEYTKTQKKEKDLKICQKKISIPELNSHKQISLDNSLDFEKKKSVEDKQKIITTYNFENVDKKHLQPVKDYKIEQHNKSDSLESTKHEKLDNGITKQENKKNNQGRYKTVFEKRNYIPEKTYHENHTLIKTKEFKDMKNVVLGNLNSAIKKENTFYDKFNKKAYELLVGRNSEKKSNKNIGNFKNLFNDKSFKDSKDFVKNKLRSKYSINKSANNRLAKGEKNIISMITKTKNIKTKSENKSFDEVKSVCYNAFSNEITKIHNLTDKSDSKVTSAEINQCKGQDNKIENNATVRYTKEIASIPDPNYKIQTEISNQENQSCVHDSKDFNMLMKTLDCDVFQFNDKVILNITNDEVRQVNTTKNDPNVHEEQKPITDVTASNQDQTTGENHEIIKSEIKEKASPDLENLLAIHKTENPESTEMTFEDVIKEIKLALQPSDQHNKTTDINEPKEDEKSISNILEDNTKIDHFPKTNKDKLNEESGTFNQGNETILKKESPISRKNIAHDVIPEEKVIDLKISKINSVLKNTSNSKDNSRKNLNKYHKDKSCIQAKVPTNTNVDTNLDLNNKVPLTIPERFLSNKTKESSSNKKTKLQEGNSVNYIKLLRSSSKSIENNKPLTKTTKQVGFNVTIKDHNDFEIPVNPVKQKRAGVKNSIPLNKPLTHFNKYSKSFINSKYNSSISKKKNVSEMHGLFYGQVGQKVNEINKTEHSFSLRDKNGINNYFLLKGLLPKIKNNKHNIDNQNCSLLKTNVCNEDPFMSIKDKQKNEIHMENEKLVKLELKKKIPYTSNEGNSESSSLFITHNAVYNPNCPVHGFKHYLNAKDNQNKPISPTNKGNMSKINEAMLSDLSRMCNKVRSNEKKPSHQLNQKINNFKLYSTAALSIKNKSPSCLCVEKRKTVKQVLMSKNESTGAKLPKGFIKKQRITKILEKDLKKINPQKSIRYRAAEAQAKEIKSLSAREASKVVGRKTNPITCHLLPHPMSKTTKIDENFFNTGFDSSYIERYLKAPPKYIPHQEIINSKNYQKERNSSEGRRVTDIFKINWSNSQKNNQQTKTSLVSIENDILVRGTCLDHVRNKFVLNKAAKHELSNDAYCNEQKTVVNSMEPSSLSNAFVQYTKDFVKCEYPTDEKCPSIRQLHKCAFRSS